MMLYENLQVIRKQIFVVLHHVVDTLNTGIPVIHTIAHHIVVLLKSERMVAEFMKFQVVAQFQATCGLSSVFRVSLASRRILSAAIGLSSM